METLKNWLVSQGVLVLFFVAFILAVFLVTLVWAALEKIQNSKLSNPLRFLLCIPLVIGGWIALGGMLGIFFREYPGITYLSKTIIEGPWIAVVFYKAIPNNGRFYSLLLIVPYVIWEGYIAYLGIVDRDRNIFSQQEGYLSILGIVLTVGSVFLIEYLKNKNEKPA
jgi:uncharacterized membrane protein